MTRSARTLFAGVLGLGLVGVGTCVAQDSEQLLVAAYSLRRRGKFQAAAAAYEQLLERTQDKGRKRLLAVEVAQLYHVMGRPEKAILLYRRNHDIDNEIDTLLALDTPQRTQEALTISRHVRYPRGEALALAKLGQTDQALKLMEAHGLTRERADLLLELGRAAEAAELYGKLQDFHAQAQAYTRAGNTRKAKYAFEDTILQLKYRIREQSLRKVEQIKGLYAGAAGVERERLRLLLAEAYGELARDYRQLAAAYVGAGRPEYLAKAPQLAKNALAFYRVQKETLLDAGAGGDAYGRAAVEHERLEATLREVEAELASYGG